MKISLKIIGGIFIGFRISSIVGGNWFISHPVLGIIVVIFPWLIWGIIVNAFWYYMEHT